MIGTNIKISWLAPNNRGDTITSYVIKIRAGDTVNFFTDSSCDGSLTTTVSD